MINRISSYSTPSAADPDFDVLVDRLIARQQKGEVLDWSALAQEHPEHASRLRSMAVALEALDDVFGTDDAAGFCPTRQSSKDDLVRGALGDFHIVREVGRGGMGVVYEAEQVSLNRRVALKVLPLAATLDPRQLERFRHEARAAGLLHHAHIVPVYGVGCERGIHYYAMQLIDGCSLAAVIGEWRALTRERRDLRSRRSGFCAVDAERTETKQPAEAGVVPNHQVQKRFRRAAELAAQTADALEYAHTMGVVHRDVKPANLLLDARGEVWITDFGLARLGEGPGLTVSGDLLGTLRYMSPEQALGGRGLVDHRTDVYSLGATLYELLTLHAAVDGATKEEVIHRLAFLEPVAPRKLERLIPLELETVTLKALAKDPRERYATAQELADDLRRWLDDRPVLARPPGPVQRLRKWSHRHRPLVVGMAVFLALVVVASCVAVVGYGVKKGELAHAWSRLADEKARSERKIADKLREVLVDRAEAIRVARQSGYRQRVWADLRQAIAIRPGDGEANPIRSTVVACLGDPIGLEPVADLKAVRRRMPPELSSKFKELARKASGGRAIAVSPRGDMIATAQRDGGVAVYDSEANRVWQKPSPLGFVYALALAADGKFLVAGCEQGFVAWNLAEPDQWVARVGNLFSVAISPSGDKLAIAGRQIELWSLITRRPIASWPGPQASAGVEFSTDGRVLLEAGARVEFSADGRVVLAVAKGRVVAGWPVSDTPERRVLDGHAKGVPAITFSSDARQVVSVSKDRTVRVWDASTGNPVRTMTGHLGEIESVAFSGDGSLLATGDLTGEVRVWRGATGELLGKTGPGGVPGQIWRLQFGPGGEYLAAAGRHLVAWTVRAESNRVELKRFCTVATVPESLGVIDLAARPNGTELIYLDRSGRMHSYDLASADNPRLIGSARVALRSLHFAPTGDRLAFITAGGTLGLWEGTGTTTGRASKESRRKPAPKVAIDVASDTHRRAVDLAVSADGGWAAVAGADRSIAVIDLVSVREIFALPPEATEIWCLAWAPDGTKLAVGLSDGTVALWDLERVRARLADFGLDSPSTAFVAPPFSRSPIPAIDHVAQSRLSLRESPFPPTKPPTAAFEGMVRLNQLREEAERARRLAIAARAAGDHAAERDQLIAALGLAERLAEAAPDAAGHRERLAWTHGALSRSLAWFGDSTAALSHLDVEAELLRRLQLEDPGNADYRRLRAQGLTVRSEILDRAGRRREAVDSARQAVAERGELAADPGTPNDHDQLGVTYNNLGFYLSRAGQTAEAERWYTTALAARDQLAHDHPATADGVKFRHSRGGTLHNLGVLRAQAGDSLGAAKLFREAAAIRIHLTDEFPTNADYASDMGRTLDWLAGMLRNLGQLDESVQQFREAIVHQGAALGVRPKDSVIRDLCCNHHAQLARTLLRMGRHAEAAGAARELRRLAPDNPAELLRAARLLAGCAAVANRTPGPPWAIGLIQARVYGGEAIALASDAVKQGLPSARARLAEADFDPVRGRDEFRTLLNALPGLQK